MQVAVKLAVGGWLGTGGVPLPGCTASEIWTPREVAAAVVATRVPEAPAGSGPAESASTRLILEEPVPSAKVRWVVPDGSVHVVAADDFSPQMLTSHEFAPVRVTEGAVWLEAEEFTTEICDAVTLGEPIVLR